MNSKLTTEEIRSRLENLFAENDLTPTRIAYREAAAVLSYFRLDRLQPVNQSRNPASAAEFGADCELTRDEQGKEAWMLKTDIRRDALRQLRQRNQMKEARSKNENDGPLQEMLDEALSDGLRLAGDLPTLRNMLTVSLWVEGVADAPPVEAVRTEILRLQLFEPFRQLVGDHFGGRVDELDAMSDYVGFFAAHSLTESVTRGIEKIFSIYDRPPLFVHGPGGIGKSTLIAKFILDHTAGVPATDDSKSTQSEFRIGERGRQLLVDALSEAFPKFADLELLLQDSLGQDLFESARPKGSIRQQFVDLISIAEARGWLEEVVAATREALPGNMKLREFAERYGSELERTIGSFPFVYLDFDRAALTAQEPITLLSEAIKQIGLEYPQIAEESLRLHNEWRERITKQDSIRQSGTTGGSFRVENREFYLSSFADFVNRLKLDNEPLLLVLDTFEEVQYRATTYVSEVFRLLNDLQKRVPRTRVVLSGRDLPKPFIDGRPVRLRPLQVGVFDTDAAVAFLRKKGIPSEEIAKRIVNQVGKTPLVLRVAADLWKREGRGDKIEGIETGFWAMLKGKRIETQLYTRILHHIHDPLPGAAYTSDEVRKLAHPGLVLRKINAELIQKVLAEPCDVLVPNIDHARQLLAALRSEFTLVTPDPNDPETVIHRADVRTLMLAALRDDQPDRVRQIHANAVTYYSQQKDQSAWAEQMYHLFSLDFNRTLLMGIDITGLDRQLPMSAIRELPEASQAFLAARLPIEVEENVWDKADPDDWAMYATQRARAALKVDDTPLAIRLIRRYNRKPNPLEHLPALLTASQKGKAKAPDVVRLLECFENAFSPAEQNELIVNRVKQKPHDFTSTFEMLLKANVDGWITELAAAALDERPANSGIYMVAQSLGLTSLSTAAESRAQQTNRLEKGSFLDINLWRERLGEIERCVCRVEWSGGFATGFLIGGGVVLIPYHVLVPSPEAPARINLTFDFRRSRDDVAAEGMVFSSGQLLDSDPVLDYALLGVLGEIEGRGWLKPTVEDISPGSALILLQYLGGESLQTTFNPNAVVSQDVSMQRLVYRMSSSPGSSGAPCFDEKLNLVAMHLSESKNLCYGVPLAAVVRMLENRGVRVPGWDAEQRKL